MTDNIIDASHRFNKRRKVIKQQAFTDAVHHTRVLAILQQAGLSKVMSEALAGIIAKMHYTLRRADTDGVKLIAVHHADFEKPIGELMFIGTLHPVTVENLIIDAALLVYRNKGEAA